MWRQLFPSLVVVGLALGCGPAQTPTKPTESKPAMEEKAPATTTTPAKETKKEEAMPPKEPLSSPEGAKAGEGKKEGSK